MIVNRLRTLVNFTTIPATPAATSLQGTMVTVVTPHNIASTGTTTYTTSSSTPIRLDPSPTGARRLVDPVVVVGAFIGISFGALIIAAVVLFARRRRRISTQIASNGAAAAAASATHGNHGASDKIVVESREQKAAGAASRPQLTEFYGPRRNDKQASKQEPATRQPVLPSDPDAIEIMDSHAQHPSPHPIHEME